MEKLINLLNEIHKIEPGLLEQLIDHRISCGKELADHPTVQVGLGDKEGEYKIGILGILNGLFDGEEKLVACYDDENGKLLDFKMMEFK